MICDCDDCVAKRRASVNAELAVLHERVQDLEAERDRYIARVKKLEAILTAAQDELAKGVGR